MLIDAVIRAGEVRGGADGSDRDGFGGEEGLPLLHRSDRAQRRHQQRASGMGLQGFCGQLQATQPSVDQAYLFCVTSSMHLARWPP